MKTLLRVLFFCSPGVAAVVVIAHLNTLSAIVYSEPFPATGQAALQYVANLPEMAATRSGASDRSQRIQPEPHHDSLHSDADNLDRGTSIGSLQRARQISYRLDMKGKMCQEIVSIKLNVINQLLEGKISLVHAARRFRECDLARAPETYRMVTQYYSGVSDIEKYSRRIMKEIEPLTGKSKMTVSPYTLARLRSELQSLEHDEGNTSSEDVSDLSHHP